MNELKKQKVKMNKIGFQIELVGCNWIHSIGLHRLKDVVLLQILQQVED